ncbi:serine/arginine repetitive matrix protein 1-like isoform X2 [Halichondria panicea]
MVEREEWTEAFRVLNLLALPSVETLSTSSPLTEYFPVNLLKNRSALEIGHSGQYLLSITSSAMVLHWKTGAIAHHWPTKNISKLYHRGKEGHLLLIVKRVSGSGPPMEFEFITDKEKAVQILKVWNVRLLESIPGDPQKLNEISLTSSVTAGGGKTKRSSRKTKSFKSRERRIEPQQPDDVVKRTSSFARFSTYGTGLGSTALSQPLPGQRTSWTDFPDSQDSYFGRFGPGVSSPPPLPARPVESSDEDDPDYAYIDETEVKGPTGEGAANVKRTPSDELDDQLNELRKSIQRENKAKKRMKAQTLQRIHTTPSFLPADPADYLVPVPSKRSQTVSVSSDCRDLSDPSSNDCSPVFVGGNPPSLPPRVGRSYGVNEDRDAGMKDYSLPAPPLPPRSPTKEFLSRKSSSSSSHSASSNHQRCPKCYSLKKSKSSVSKTVSLEQRSTRMPAKEESRKSMPNLENDIRHRHCCSQDSEQFLTTTHSREYLQLMEDKESSNPVLGPDRAYLQLMEDKGSSNPVLGPELDLLSSCLQTLEVRSKTKGDESPTKKKRNPYDHIQLKSEDTMPPPQPPPRHRPLTSSKSLYVGANTFTPPPNRTRPNGHLPRTSIDHTPRSVPPVPPRSNASLTETVSKSPRLGRSSTLQAKHHPPPVRSNSSMDHTPSYQGNSRYGYSGGSQVESSSSTVFIHHLKERPRLAHMV